MAVIWPGGWGQGHGGREEDLLDLLECPPFQPHRADAGAVRASPGTSQKRVSVTV